MKSRGNYSKFEVDYFLLAGVVFLSLFHHSNCSGTIQTTTSNSQKITCRFRNREYSPSEVWYPSSAVVTGYCVSCICLNTGRQNCTKLECPTNCEGNPNEHPCCKSCGEKTTNVENLSSRRSGSSYLRNQPTATTTTDNLDSSSSSQSQARETETRSFQRNTFGQEGVGKNKNNENESGEDMDEDEDEAMVVTENPDFSTCLHQGKRYKDGDSFTANVSGLPIASVDQCMQCKCQTGMVVCHMDACSGFKCESSGSSGLGSSSDVDTCCQRCAAKQKTLPKMKRPEDEPRLPPTRKPNNNNMANNPPRISGFVGTGTGMFDSESAVAFRDVNNIRALGNMARDNNGVRKQATDDCISAGRFYMHGSAWHPIIGPFGAMECVVCKCNHGQIECQSLKCPPKRELPCSKPVKVEGHCCPICNSQSSDRQQPTIVETGQVMCVPAKQDVTSFKTQGVGTNGSEFIEFAFVRQRRTNPDIQVETHLWTLRDGDIDEFTTQYLSLAQFDNLRTRQTFVLLGATNEKNIEKFTRREKKLEKRCFTKCSIRITSLERSLRLHRLTPRTNNCLAHERQVVTA